jgi:hypothetical protein
MTPTYKPRHKSPITDTNQTVSNIRSLTASLFGVAAGTLGLESLPGFFFYFVGTAVVSLLVFSLKAKSLLGRCFMGFVMLEWELRCEKSFPWEGARCREEMSRPTRCVCARRGHISIPYASSRETHTSTRTNHENLSGAYGVRTHGIVWYMPWIPMPAGTLSSKKWLQECTG